MKKIALLFLCLIFLQGKAQNYGRVVFKTNLNKTFMVSLNGVRTSNTYYVKTTFDYLEDNDYKAKVYIWGLPSPINFNVNNAPGYETVYVLGNDQYGGYALSLESKITFSAIPAVTNTVITNTVVATPVNTVTIVSDKEFKDFMTSLKNEHFDDARNDIARSFAKSQQFNSLQVKEVVQAFTFEDPKVEIAKFMYDRTVDKQNYYKVYSAFSFPSSKKEVENYINKKK